MNRIEIVKKIIEAGAVAVIRLSDTTRILKIVEAIHKGGVNAIEITMTIPNALGILENLSKNWDKEVFLGVGSVLNTLTAEQAINAGAKFIVSPIFKREIISTVHKYELPVIPGCFSPTEIQLAYENDADIIKIFPADVLGVEFLKAIKAPLPHLSLMPTGGVTLTNAGEWIKSGASVVGVGSALLDKEAICANNYYRLTEKARVLIDSINSARK